MVQLGKSWATCCSLSIHEKMVKLVLARENWLYKLPGQPASQTANTKGNSLDATLVKSSTITLSVHLLMSCSSIVCTWMLCCWRMDLMRLTSLLSSTATSLGGRVVFSSSLFSLGTSWSVRNCFVSSSVGFIIQLTSNWSLPVKDFRLCTWTAGPLEEIVHWLK